ncbi:hypothetical protein [Brevundimonas sp.]|uniref:membrane protein YczE n=1 Tax=Brevundimonas sp. TaxID=1871086 RepID=UPI002D2AE490|nr:hypothetical protein [Brevundimonas sp.]HYC96784.1 hypothetical protein [Brevundimonas sp.]
MFIRRFTQLQIGLLLYGLSIALMVRGGLGMNPWGVFHQGLSEVTGVSLGMVVNGVGALVLLVWIPLRQWPGIGTLSNVLVIGVATDAALWLLPPVEGLALRSLFLIAAIVLNGVATGAYIGAGLGAGPRDGLTTGVVRLTGWQVRWVRMGIEAAVLALGWMLGGAVGVGTILYTLSTGPLMQAFLPMFTLRAPSPAPSPVPSSS